MNIPSPVTVTLSGVQIELSKLNVLLVDDATQKTAIAFIRPLPKPLTLWEHDAYDAAGDYTQAQVEAKIAELLGDDLAAGLSALI